MQRGFSLKWIAALAGLVLLVLGRAGTSEPVVLENEYVRIAIDPARGGAIRSMFDKKATNFPYIADKDGGLAGAGMLFAPRIANAGGALDLSGLSLKTTRTGSVVKMSGALAGGLTFEREIAVDPQESGFRIADTVRNGGASAATLKLGSGSRQAEDRWRVQQRSWSGESPRLFWRIAGQYGVGFLYQAKPPAGPVQLARAKSEFEWWSAEQTVPAGTSISWSSEVLIDEGGGPAKLASVAAGEDRFLVSADIAGGGRSGQAVHAFATVVGARPGAVRLVVSRYYGDADRQTLEDVKLSLEPGAAARRSCRIVPEKKGLLYLEAKALDAAGRVLAVDRNYAVIDGDGMSGEAGEQWRAFLRRMPEESYRGSWEEIGRQIALNRQPIGGPTTLQVTRKQADTALAFYHDHLPYYAKMLEGAARGLAGKVTDAMRIPWGGPEDPGEACMNVFFDGPDGPINAYSKERSGKDFKGLGYIKVVPTEGYPFHMYMKWGVNSEGLASAGATLNEAASTKAAGEAALKERIESGGQVVPEVAGMWMLLASCRNVEEAVRFIQRKDAPLQRTGNMLLVDRAGDWAIVQSVGIIHQVLRKGSVQGFPSAGNYPHVQPDGLFQIGAWGQASNTMLRERFLLKVAGARMGKVGLDDVFSLMQTHGPGGMCQHIYDNPAGIYSNTSSIAVTRTSDLYLTQGPPCEVEYVRHSLKD